jgi:hypothetical protein
MGWHHIRSAGYNQQANIRNKHIQNSSAFMLSSDGFCDSSISARSTASRYLHRLLKGIFAIFNFAGGWGIIVGFTVVDRGIY